MRSGPNDIVFTNRLSAEKHVTVNDLGVQLAAETPDKLGGILLALANNVPGWGSEATGWGSHCKRVADELPPDECSAIVEVLLPIIVALRSRSEAQQSASSRSKLL